ncbi:helix-turn-helix domain-containing protein [Reyranella sp.]|uniref:helix-turn-helix domain-containing protein n=1 Tax=Reyranella sp. TaxID=1929291 RepID=UPI002731E82A|nr:helix-turn-helix domain-containing protein [Reyranella sp.]MDP2376088.1 helix-turn-helix domain-containing protein [Reyranella sp.]
MMTNDTTTIIGRARIAHLLGRSERTISRWIRRGILRASKAGPFDNNLLKVSITDLERLKDNDSASAA